MDVARIDHIALVVSDVARSCEFYCQVLGMTKVNYKSDQVALNFGDQQIKLYQLGCEQATHAETLIQGSADLCFITTTPLIQAMSTLNHHQVPLIDGPVARDGALGPIQSLYFKDPDGNLIEVSRYSNQH